MKPRQQRHQYNSTSAWVMNAICHLCIDGESWCEQKQHQFKGRLKIEDDGICPMQHPQHMRCFQRQRCWKVNVFGIKIKHPRRKTSKIHVWAFLQWQTSLISRVQSKSAPPLCVIVHFHLKSCGFPIDLLWGAGRSLMGASDNEGPSHLPNTPGPGRKRSPTARAKTATAKEPETPPRARAKNTHASVLTRWLTVVVPSSRCWKEETKFIYTVITWLHCSFTKAVNDRFYCLR